MNLLTYPAVAERLGVSLALVQTLSAAADYAAEVRQGQRQIADVPPRYRAHLDTGFPRPLRLGLRLRRIRETDLQQWLERR